MLCRRAGGKAEPSMVLDVFPQAGGLVLGETRQRHIPEIKRHLVAVSESPGKEVQRAFGAFDVMGLLLYDHVRR